MNVYIYMKARIYVTHEFSSKKRNISISSVLVTPFLGKLYSQHMCLDQWLSCENTNTLKKVTINYPGTEVVPKYPTDFGYVEGSHKVHYNIQT